MAAAIIDGYTGESYFGSSVAIKERHAIVKPNVKKLLFSQYGWHVEQLLAVAIDDGYTGESGFAKVSQLRTTSPSLGLLMQQKPLSSRTRVAHGARRPSPPSMATRASLVLVLVSL